jgi:hypothetical protein
MRFVVALAAGPSIAAPPLAHHSFAMFDCNQELTSPARSKIGSGPIPAFTCS